MPQEILAANALTTLSRVKLELGIGDVVADDDYLRFQINVATGMIEDWLGRRLDYEAGIVERVPMYGGNRIVISRTPVWAVTKIEIVDGSAVVEDVDVSDVRIENPGAGFLYRRAGWAWAVPRPGGTIARDPLPGQEPQSVEVTYDGGYVLPAAGTVPAGTERLPSVLERALVLAVSTSYRQRGRDRTIKAEKLMSYSVTYGGAEGSQSSGDAFAKAALGGPFPAEVIAMLRPYRRVRGAA